MQTDNRILDDLARVASGALSGVTGLKREVEARLKDQFARILGEMDMVAREEFEVVRAMAARARAEQGALEDRVARLEARIAGLEARLEAADIAPTQSPAAPDRGLGEDDESNPTAG